ncbi:Hsp20/alpha crystallin family protein [archaeon]|nr:Hsp20/alpha crystallin family protein [archaeon]
MNKKDYLMPFSGNFFRDFHKSFDEIFENFGFFGNKYSFPVLKNTEDEYLIQTDLPGFKKEDIKVKASEGMLEIIAKRESKKDEVFERRSFNQKYSLPKDIDLDTVPKAVYENGVLKLTFKRLYGREEGAKEIKIK